jgi:hypothetical protein
MYRRLRRLDHPSARIPRRLARRLWTTTLKQPQQQQQQHAA